MKELTIESLQADHAYHEGIDWITPLLAEGDLEAVKVALCNEKPFWAQWAHANGYSVLPRDAAKRNGAMVAGDRLVFDQTAGHYSTQTAGHFSTQTAEFGSRHRATSIPVTFVCRYWINGRYKMNAVVCDGEKLKAQIFYTFDTESETWVEAEDQTERT